MKKISCYWAKIIIRFRDGSSAAATMIHYTVSLVMFCTVRTVRT